MTLSLLIVDDEASIRETLIEFFETFGYTVRGAATATEGRSMAAEHAPDVVLLDLRLPDADGTVAMEALLADDPEVGIILLTGFADVRVAVSAMQRGALDVLEKPVDLEKLAAAVTRAAERGRSRRELAVLRTRQRSAGGADSGRAAHESAPPALPPTLERLIELAARNADAPVLLQGETGTGKGFVARQIHDRSSRNQFPFIEINCSTLTPAFFESELFGHERGAFTDARQAKRGLLEIAAGGTVFLDEIADMSPEVQPRFLKVIEEHTFRRLGGTTLLRSSARFLVATHQPLEQAVADRRFRADLYYRLQVLTIALPPLRERRGELAGLALTLLPRGASIGADAMRSLSEYAWPGNIRELRNALWRAAILADGRPIDPEHLALSPSIARAQPAGPHVDAADDAAPPTLEASERRTIAAALKASAGNRTRAAQHLGIARSTLLEKLKRYPELA